MKRQKLEEYIRICKRCLKSFTTKKRHSKICPKCDKRNPNSQSKIKSFIL